MRAAEAAGDWTSVKVPTPQGPVSGRWHPVTNARGAIVMVGGSRGGVRGPAGVYAPLALRLQVAGIAGLRLSYRHPNRLAECVADVLAGVAWLGEHGIERVVLIGWSFGGAVVIGAGAASEPVAGVATVASQTYGAELVGRLAPRPLLLLHGTADRILSDACSRRLYARAGQPKELVLYPGDDHGLTRHALQALDRLYAWSIGQLGTGAGVSDSRAAEAGGPARR